MSRRAKKMQNSSAPVSSGDEGPARKAKKAPKKGRRWNADGFASEEDDVQLDYSATANGPTSESEAEGRSTALEEIDSSTWGTKTSKGQFVLKDLDDEVNDILASAQSKSEAQTGSSGLVGAGFSSISGLFRNVVGGKTLTKDDLKKPMDGMKDHLIKKNVAPEAAVRLRDSVEHELIGLKTGNFESIDARIAKAMEASLTKMLTPTSSLDLLREVDAVTRPSALSSTKPRPYVISVVGVNGVGKSTNLSKICFFLLENKYKVLVVAGDTFRSGAVEQLKVHVRNLKELTKREGGKVELFEKGYGGDAATVARDAVRAAASEGFDVVLVDTAGRRHNDQRLMSNLEKFAKFANPDKILMVGEVRRLVELIVKYLLTCRVGARRERLGRTSTELQCVLWARQESGWIHHIQVRYGWRHGRHDSQHCARDECASPICWCGPALRRYQKLLSHMGCQEIVECQLIIHKRLHVDEPP
jgi:signal recognition particle receptor subunit alpha